MKQFIYSQRPKITLACHEQRAPIAIWFLQSECFKEIFEQMVLAIDKLLLSLLSPCRTCKGLGPPGPPGPLSPPRTKTFGKIETANTIFWSALVGTAPNNLRQHPQKLDLQSKLLISGNIQQFDTSNKEKINPKSFNQL